MPAAETDFLEILRLLARDDVEFLIVGATAAALQGAPVVTLDLDIVHRRSPENVGRLLSALRALDAIYRDPAGRALRPDASGLAGSGHHLLATRHGPLDALGAIEQGLGFDDLARRSHDIDLEPGLRVRVLGLEALIELKEGSSREKDQLILPLLRRTLEESGRRK